MIVEIPDELIEQIIFDDECFGIVKITLQGIEHWRNREKEMWLRWKLIK